MASGLNEALSNKEIQTSTMPSWFSTAQQNVATGMGNITAPSTTGTAGESAINAFGATGPFSTGAQTLNAIGAGAANPWLTSTNASGQTTVSPNTSTPLGGLFQAQTDYLNEILPDVNATASAPAIGSGNFGSKMNQSAIAKARSQAASDLFQKQMTAALQNQQTGVSAGAALGNLGNQQVQSGLNTGTWQLNVPYSSALNQATILSKMNVPTSTEKQVQLSPFNQIAGLGSLVSGGLNSLLGTTVLDKNGNPIAQPGMLEQIKRLTGQLTGKQQGSGGTIPTGPVTDVTPTNLQPGQEGYGWQYYSDGTAVDPYGNYYQNGQLVYQGNVAPSDSAMAEDSNFNWSDWYSGDNGYGSYGE